MVVLLFLIDTGKEFDMSKLLFEVIVYNAEQETTYGILHMPSLIYEVLMHQHNILGEDEMLEILFNHCAFHKSCLRASMHLMFRNLLLSLEMFQKKWFYIC